MKKYTVSALIVAIVFAVTLVAWAQRDPARRQRWQKQREMQQQAIVKIQEHTAKLKADMDQSSQPTRDRSQRQSLSEDERNQRREARRKQREERQKIVADLESQIAILKGPRQLKNEHEEALTELKAIRDLALEEKAAKSAERLSKLIDKTQKGFDETQKLLGFEQ